MRTSTRRLTGTLLTVAAMGLLGTACDKAQEKTTGMAPAQVPSGKPQPAAMAVQTLPGDVLVSVNGADLTRKRVEQDVALRLDAVKQQIPPEQMPAAREQTYRTVIEQFIIRQLLLGEAKQRGIVITDADRSNAYTRIAENLPEGTTVEEAMRTSPMGEARMKEELEAGLVITKLLAGEMSNAVAVTDQDVAAFREKNKDNLQLPEKVRASHILIAVNKDDDEAAKAEKKKTAEEIRTQLTNGADFAETAAARSDGPTKSRGGDLGVFGRGQMVKAFEDAAFGQAVGEIGPVIETQFGYHIIKVTQHDQPQALTDDKIREMLQRQRQREVTGALIDRLRQKADIKLAPGLEERGVEQRP